MTRRTDSGGGLDVRRARASRSRSPRGSRCRTCSAGGGGVINRLPTPLAVLRQLAAYATTRPRGATWLSSLRVFAVGWGSARWRAALVGLRWDACACSARSSCRSSRRCGRCRASRGCRWRWSGSASGCHEQGVPRRPRRVPRRHRLCGRRIAPRAAPICPDRDDARHDVAAALRAPGPSRARSPRCWSARASR